MEALNLIKEYQNGLFGYLEEFFIRITGQSAQDFAPLEDFSIAIKKNPKKLARRTPEAIEWVFKTIMPYYADKGMGISPLAKELGGLKLVVGGSGRIGEAHIDSIQQTLLYADTVLIPDPFLAWIESSREGDRFREINLLKSAFLLLQLKPIIDANLTIPAIFVFPSFEKLLEEHDPETFDKQRELITDVFIYYVSPSINTFDDIQKFCTDNPDAFLSQVEKHNLFVPPGSKIGDPINKALSSYEEFILTWRSSKFIEYFSGLTPTLKILTGIMERLAPQHHLLENSEELRANPLICLEEHAHYFKLIARTNSQRLVDLSLLDRKQTAIMDALGSREFQWLSRVPMKALIELRNNNENAKFRNRLFRIAERLHEAELDKFNIVITEINKDISEMIDAHDREVKEIQQKYSRKHGQTAVLAWAALSALLIPFLAPILGKGAPLILAAQYTRDKIEELIAKSKASKSLFGVLARSKLK